jgi:hypothetical protein
LKRVAKWKRASYTARAKDASLLPTLGDELLAEQIIHIGADVWNGLQAIGDIGIEHNVDAPLLRFCRQRRAPTLGGCEEFLIELPNFAVTVDVWPFHICFFLSCSLCEG